MRHADIYPDIWDEGESLLDEFVLPSLAELRLLYGEAAATKSAAIAGIS